MSKKNSSVNLKTGFKYIKDLEDVYLHFKKKLDEINEFIMSIEKKYEIA